MTSLPGQEAITILIFPNNSRCKGNQAMQFDHVIEQEKHIFSKIMQKMNPGHLFQSSFCFLEKLYMR